MITDQFGHEWEKERFNGHSENGLALSFIMFCRGEPIEAVREQQKLEEPIGGWQAAYRRQINAQ